MFFLGKKKPTKLDKFITISKTKRCILLDEDKKNKACKFIKTRVSVDNVLAVYAFAQLFKLPNVSELCSRLIERCFSIISESPSFLELEVASLAEILSSDGLDIDSEMEIALAAENWLLHNFNERSGFARLLLLKVRLPLLSVAALNRLKNKPCFGANCSGVIDDVIRENTRSSPLGTTSRYCNQHRFDVIVSGGLVYGEVVSDVYEVGANSFEVRNYPKLKTERHYSEMLCLRGELYVFGGLDAAR